MQNFKILVFRLFIIITLFINGNLVFGQKTCGTDDLHKQKMQNDPAYKLKMDRLEEYIQSPGFRRNQARTVGGTTIYTIPLVFHVMHKGEPIGTGTNISKADIQNSVKALNSRYRKIPGGIGDGAGVDIGIEFALAVRDPNGNCTDGIVRYDMTGDATYMANGVGTPGVTDTYLKSLSFWNSFNYYNIWVVSEIDDNGGGAGTQGYAYFPGAHGSAIDGAIMLANCITDTTRVTLPHELGHALNLYHTFEGDANGTACPPNANCNTDGDQVCDTPPHIRSPSNCPTGTNACDGGTPVSLYYHNYMDYSADICQNEFTAGQKPRVIAALTTTRASLLEENGNMSLIPPSSPTIDFTTDKSIVCTGQKVQFTDGSFCVPNVYIPSIGWNNITFSWTITNNAGTTLTSTVQNPIFTMSNAGTYDATLAITTVYGTTSYTKQGIVVVSTSPVAATCNGSSTYTGAIDYGIHEFKLNTINHSSGSTLDDDTQGLTISGYGDFSCKESTILSPNTTYPITLLGSSNTSGTVFEDFAVYIDYNNDGDFVDAGEQVIYRDNIAAPAGYQIQNFTTPASPTLNTPLRMRVFSARGSETITPCFITTRGQVHDFAVIISNKVASVTIAAAPSSTITYGTGVTFTATPVNGGAGPVYKWYLNGVLQAGFTGPTFNSSTLLNGDQVYCVMVSNLSGVIASPATSNTISMVVTGPPLSNFTQDKTIMCAGSTVVFTDQSLLSPTSWSWTTTGGTPATSTSQNPSIVYNTAGTYNVSLTASNGFGTGTTNTKTNLITVYAVPATICAAITRSTAPAGNIGITNFTLNTINNTTPYNDAVVIDNACSMITNLTKGNTYSVSMTGSTINNQWLRVYIDYNGDGDFNDAGELIYSPAVQMGTRSGSFTVPATATTSQILRLRVITDFTNTLASAGPCTTPLQYGQVEDYGVIINSALPVSLVSLDANRINSKDVKIEWTLAQYSEVDQFVVERSFDGINFQVVQSVTPPAHQSSITSQFQAQDYNDSEGITYYRLKIVYTNGTLEYSASVVLKANTITVWETEVYPIPVTGNEFTLHSSIPFSEGEWEIWTATGSLQSKGALIKDINEIKIPSSQLTNGCYFIKIMTTSGMKTVRFIIMR